MASAFACIDRDKLPKGQGYPIRTGQLEELFAQQGWTIWADLSYSPAGISESICCVHFYLPGWNIPHMRIFVSVSSFPREVIPAIREQLEPLLFPRLAGWLNGILALPQNSPLLVSGRSFHAKFRERQVEIVESEK